MANSKHRQTLLKRNSLAQITLGIRKHGPISRVQLSRTTGLSPACVCGIVDELIEEGLLIEAGTQAGSRGRPMVLVDINPDGKPVVGLWISSGGSVEIAVANPKAEILARKSLEVGRTDFTSAPFVNNLMNEIRKCVESAGKNMESVQGIGLSIADKVDPLLGVIDSRATFGGWSGISVVRLFSEKLGIPAYAENDVRAAAYTSLWLGADTPVGGALYVTISRGIGSAYVNNHDVLRGAHGTAGELGHITIDRHGPLCICGNRGCLATLATDVALITNVWPELTEEATSLPIEERTELVRKAMQLAVSGDARARSSLAIVTECLGMGIASAINMFDPRSVFVGGNLIEPAPELVMDMIRAEALRHVWVDARGVEILPIKDWREFLRMGSIGLVLLHPYRILQQDNLNARLVTDPSI